MDKKNNMFTTDWWLPEDQQWKNRQNVNPPNFMNIYESLAFMHNTKLKNQKKIIKKLERIEKKLDDLINKENENDGL